MGEMHLVLVTARDDWADDYLALPFFCTFCKVLHVLTGLTGRGGDHLVLVYGGQADVAPNGSAEKGKMA